MIALSPPPKTNLEAARREAGYDGPNGLTRFARRMRCVPRYVRSIELHGRAPIGYAERASRILRCRMELLMWPMWTPAPEHSFANSGDTGELARDQTGSHAHDQTSGAGAPEQISGPSRAKGPHTATRKQAGRCVNSVRPQILLQTQTEQEIFGASPSL